jgi:hypothetical protein
MPDYCEQNVQYIMKEIEKVLSLSLEQYNIIENILRDYTSDTYSIGYNDANNEDEL